MKRALWIGLWAVLAVILYLSIVRPHEIVSPGNLIPAHSKLQGDCFACHAPFQGASAQRCTTCHLVADIGLRTTKGVAIPSAKRSRGFHQALAEPDCMACHSDHPRPSLAKARAVKFDHGQLKPESRAKCQTCHLPPRDNLHAGQTSACSTCHLPSAWKPATFDHGRYFALDGDHNAACTTCHVGGNYKRYTCYGCHEHREARIIAEHREEGITRIDNCVRCHRSAHGEGAWEGEGEDD